MPGRNGWRAAAAWMLVPAMLGGVAVAQAQTVRPVDGFVLDGRIVQGGIVRGKAPRGTASLMLGDVPVPIAADGRFLIAFDRDAPIQVSLTAVLADGRRIGETLAIDRREWRIERLNSLPRFSQPSAEFQARRPGELARIEAARNIGSDSQGWRQSFVWPVTGRISGLFGAQRIYRGEPGAYHGGVDVARPTGTPIIAPADGVVVLAAEAPFTLEGNLLMLDHGMGLNSAFLHLSRIDVRAGQRVRQGQVIGAIGTTGRSTGPHLHWGMKWGDARIDPLLVAGPMTASAAGTDASIVH
ncbi:M23 family metallopeptidase [Sphingomonas sp. FW199]|uniref:M23 family metallopeptidase n=1 Tax=Sphingomonas sp. FW199 TaxID=3400217 RepID=UPI003CEC0E44